ncbi:hypothetical protein DICVIV_07361 [Dictyocaulus viviparus]|uniref:Uncharacterized protein n=1 Tax=Dictyocaulus viviparus TaxID=29172 RepID=A0A0D8XPK0_DICVI|nr:hypothetical protein DICVIV_07361 [Dictyocaulus viviparus]
MFEVLPVRTYLTGQRIMECNKTKAQVQVRCPSEIRHAIPSAEIRTALGPDSIRPEHVKNMPPVLIETLVGLFTSYLSEWSQGTCSKSMKN